ncbi:hypothetical protein ACFLTZ_04810 [Chloroflexota bacterium]
MIKAMRVRMPHCGLKWKCRLNIQKLFKGVLEKVGYEAIIASDGERCKNDKV